MFSRREFLATSTSAIPYVALGRRWSHASVLRIGTVTDATRPELERGLAFGVAEAQRSASLFQWTVERVPLAVSGATPATPPVSTVIMAAVGPPPNDTVPVLRLVCDPSRTDDGSFILAPCEHGEENEVWQPTLERYGAAQLNDRYRSATGRPMSGDAWLGWFAVKLLADSALKLRTADPRRLQAHLALSTTVFDGHKGAPLRFDGRRRLVQPLYAKSGRPTG
ncbi:MAG TPA: hypothetical protein VFZ21_31575 [Gemmatimonadaceae bacterium]|nr:hypothetical protein [Gemmatimonadaceae bacterium]